MEKEKFFTEQYILLLHKLSPDTEAQWGLLSPQGMVEHMTDSIGIAWKRIVEPIQVSSEQMEKMRAFAMSEKEFKPGTKNSLMPETPAPLRNENLQSAILELENEIKMFVNFYKANPDEVVTNPFFGPLNYAEWLHLLHKHACHHLKQFNLI